MKRTLDKEVVFGLALVVALLVISAALTYRNTSQLAQDRGRVAHSQEVMELTDGVLSTLVDAETGERGFLITGKDTFLEPYNAARERLHDGLAKLKEATRDNPSQQSRIEKLEDLVAQRLDLLKQAIELKRRNTAQAQAFIQADAGKAKMDAVRAQVADMKRAEEDLLKERQLVSARAYQVAMTTNLITALVGLLLVGAFVWLLHRSLLARANAAAAIHEHRQLLQTTLASIGDAVIATDFEGRVTFLNSVAQMLTGFKHDEAHGRPLDQVFTIINEQTRLPVTNPALRAIQEGRVVGLANHTVLISKGGAERPLEDSAAPIRDEKGTVSGAVLVFRDVTEKRRTENVLRAHEQELRRSLEVLKLTQKIGKIGSWEWNSATDDNKWTPEIEALYGLPPGGFEGGYQGWAKLVHPDDRAKAEQDVRRALETGDYFSEFRVIWPDGTVHWLETRAHVFKDAEGKAARIMGVNMDITERKEAEERLRESREQLRQRAEQLAERDRRKDEFLATLAHELRNPLAPIRNALHIMHVAGTNGAALAQVRDIMERQVTQMVRLVDDLMDVSRITRGKINLVRERLELAAVIESALETSRPLIEAAKHELVVQLPPEPLTVIGDLTRLAQVISNLLNNAAKYTPEGGHIRLLAEREDRQAVIRVRDDGMGIAPAMVPKIFEMFTQVDNTLERAQGGLGIGLTLVRRLVEMHGGKVEAHSEGTGRGSEFVIRLPLAPETEDLKNAAEEGVSQPPGQSAGQRVLVVDDNHDSAESLAMLLRMRGHDVRTTHDGPEALEAARAFRPEVVLLDIGLPGMNGYEVARRMREMPELKDALLIAQTGWGQEEDRRRSVEAGFNAHLVKPIDPAALQELLKRHEQLK